MILRTFLFFFPTEDVVRSGVVTTCLVKELNKIELKREVWKIPLFVSWLLFSNQDLNWYSAPVSGEDKRSFEFSGHLVQLFRVNELPSKTKDVEQVLETSGFCLTNHFPTCLHEQVHTHHIHDTHKVYMIINTT